MQYRPRIHYYIRFFKLIAGAAVFLLMHSNDLFAQQNSNYSFRHISQQDGLLHNVVLSVTQDEKGFIWVVTRSGLQRYDGLRFLPVNDMLNDPADPRAEGSIAYADIKNNCLWIQKATKIEKLSLSNNQVTVYDPVSLPKNPAFHFDYYTAGTNASWALSNKVALAYYDGAPDSFKTNVFNINPFNSHANNYFAGDTASAGNVWMTGNTDGLYLFDKQTKKIYSTANNPLHIPMLEAFNKQLGSNRPFVRHIMHDTRHNYWVTMWRDVFYRYNTLTGKLYTYSLPAISKQLAIGNTAEKIVNSIYEDNHGVIWIGTENAGLLKYDAEKDNFETIFIDGKSRPNNEYNYAIVTIFQDREENIWLGTDKGITIFNPYRQYFQSVHHEPGNKASLPKSEINCFIQAGNGDILIGTWGGGITVYDSAWQYKKNILLNGPVDQNLVWSFIKNDDGNIWAGCQHGYIDIYNPQTQTINSIHPPEVENITIYSMAKDAKGNIWLGLYNGKIAKWDKQENKFYAYSGGANEKLSPVMHIFFDKQGQCWVSTTSGFKKFDTEKRIYTEVYLPDAKNPAAITGRTTGGIEQYDDSTLVIGSVNGGVLFFNTKTKTFSRFDEGGKLPSNNVYAIKKDTKGNVWFTTDYNLYKFTLPNKAITHYNLAPGVIGSSFTTTNIETLQDGRWMTATATNIISFDPAVLALPQNTAAPVEITGFRVFDKPLFVDSLLAINQPVQLTYKQHFFTVEFSLLSFSQLRQTRYYYRLRGVNSDWVDAGTKQFANYTNLEPGTYHFEVKADNGNGMTPVTSFQIIIAAPFWKTTWFKLLVLALAGLLVYLFVKWRIKNVRVLMANKIQAIEFEQSLQQAKMEVLGINEKLSEARLEALRSQMNPHFIFNCLNSIDNLIQNNEKEKATQYLAKFARLIRAVLETSKSNTVPCWKDMETLKVYIELEALRLDNKFSYHINVSEDILNGDYKVPPLVIQPFVENAIHHGLLNKIPANRQLSVDVTALGNSIHYVITDNGVGRAKAASYKQLNKPAHMSMGMQITSERIHLFNQQTSGSVKITDLYNENQQPCGTRVEVELLNQ